MLAQYNRGVKRMGRAAPRRGWRTGWSIAAPVVGWVIALPATAGAAPLKPDLQPLNPSPIRLCEEAPNAINPAQACVGGGRTVLRLHGYLANAGAGPLEYAAVPPAQDIPADCHGDGNPDIDGDGDGDDNDVLVRQRLFDDVDGNGAFSRSVDTSSVSIDVGCRYYHPEHDHYHVEAFARYSLQSVATGAIARSAGKISFCVADTDPFNLALPGAPPASSGGFYSDDDLRRPSLDPGESRSAGPTITAGSSRARRSTSPTCLAASHCLHRRGRIPRTGSTRPSRQTTRTAAS